MIHQIYRCNPAFFEVPKLIILKRCVVSSWKNIFQKTIIHHILQLQFLTDEKSRCLGSPSGIGSSPSFRLFSCHAIRFQCLRHFRQCDKCVPLSVGTSVNQQNFHFSLCFSIKISGFGRFWSVSITDNSTSIIEAAVFACDSLGFSYLCAALSHSHGRQTYTIPSKD